MRATIQRRDELLARLASCFGALLVAIALVLRFELGPPLEPLFFVGTAFLFLAPAFRSRRQLQDATLELAPGRMLVRPKQKGRATSISMKELTGASTATLDGNVTLALATGPGRNPLALSFDEPAHAKQAREALGIGRSGFGLLVWDLGARLLHRLAIGARVIGALVSTVVCILFFASDRFAATHDLGSRSTVLVVAGLAYVWLTDATTSRRTISLMPRGIRIFDEVAQTFEWHEIEGALARPNALVLSIVRQRFDRVLPTRAEVVIDLTPPSRFRDGVGPREAEIIVAQIRAAAARARGTETKVDHVSQIATLLELRRGESVEEWIRRIDGLADGWRVSPPRHGETEAYRAALWATLEDHDADALVRALAARVLSRLDRNALEPRLRVLVATTRSRLDLSHLEAAIAQESDALVAAIEKRSHRA